MSIGSIAFWGTASKSNKYAASGDYPTKSKVPGVKKRALIELLREEYSNDRELPQSIPKLKRRSHKLTYFFVPVPFQKIQSDFHEQNPDLVDVHPDSVEHGMFTINTDGDSIER